MTANNPPPSLERLTMMWGPAITSETRSTQTIQRKPKKAELARTLRTAKKVVLPSRAVSLAGGMPPDYELMDKLGEGGMGVVYLARQTSIDRTIAIKMLKPDVSQDDDVRGRFLAEAAVTGALDHPNIVPVYDLGTNESGALFYAMKRVRGTPWCEVLTHKTQEENLEIWTRTADAVAFAHSRGIIHRDLKPENVMLGDFGEVLVMDWGLAMTVGLNGRQTPLDAADSMAGTPAYMAPEMASGNGSQIHFCSDIYLLGAILYEIVAGKPPHTGKNVMGCLFNAACNKIEKTDRKGELVDIALKAMETAPRDRYESVADIRAAVKSYLSHLESIRLADKAAAQLQRAHETNKYNDFAQAVFGFREALEFWDGNRAAEVGISQASLVYAKSAFARGDLDLATSLLEPEDPTHVGLLLEVQTEQVERTNREIRFGWLKRFFAWAAILVFVVVLAAFLVVNDARRNAEKQQALAETQTKLAVDESRKARAAEALALEAQKEEAAQKQKAVEQERNALAAKEDAEKARIDADKRRIEADLSRNAALLARKDAQEAQARADYDAYIAQVGLAASKVDENSFRHALALLAASNPEQRNWEWGRLSYLCNRAYATFDGHNQRLDAISYRPDGKQLVTGSWDGNARIWDTATAATVRTLGAPAHTSYVHAAAYSPDGTRIVTGDFDGRVAVWNADDGTLLKVWQAHTKAVYSTSFTANGQGVLTSGADYNVKLWHDWAAPQPQAVVYAKQLGQLGPGGKPIAESHEGHTGWVWSAALSPSGRRIVSAAQDGTVIVWDVASAKPLTIYREHESPVFSACFLEEDRVASGGDDRAIRIWKTFRGETERVLQGHLGTVRKIVPSKDGSRLLSGGNDNTARLWEAFDGSPLAVYRGHSGWVSSVCFSPDERFAASASHDADAKLWDIENYRESVPLVGHAKDVLTAAFDPEGRFVMTGGLDRVVKLWDPVTGQEIRTFDEGHSARVNRALFSQDEKYVLTISEDMTAILWDRERGGEIHRFRDHLGSVNAAAFSADGRYLVTGGRDQAVRVWDMATKEAVLKLDDLKSEVLSLAITPDGGLILVGFESGRFRLYDRAGKLLRHVDGHTRAVNGIAFAAGGKAAVTVSSDRTGAFWDLASGIESLPSLRHDGAVTALAVSPDGRLVATGDEHHFVRLWGAGDRRLLMTLAGPTGAVKALAFSADGSRLAAVSADHTVRLWKVADGTPDRILTARRSPVPETEIPLQTVTSVSFSKDGTRLLIGGDAEAILWNLAAAREEQSYARHNEVSALALDAGKRWMATSGSDRVIKLWDLEANLVFAKFLDGHEGTINGLAFSPDAKRLISVGNDKRAVVWDIAADRKPNSFEPHEARIASIAFSPDGKWVVTASYDNTAKVWNPATGEIRCTMVGHTSFVLSAAFSNDGTMVVTGSADNTARVWDARTGKPVQAKLLEGHTAYVKFAAFSNDGSRILTGSEDNTARLWDAMTGQEILSLKGHRRELTWVGFAPHDPLLVMTASRDATAIIWPAVQWEKNDPKKPRRPLKAVVEAVLESADGKPTDAKPGDGQSADAKPAEAKPADAKPADAKPADAKPAEVNP